MAENYAVNDFADIARRLAEIAAGPRRWAVWYTLVNNWINFDEQHVPRIAESCDRATLFSSEAEAQRAIAMLVNSNLEARIWPEDLQES